MSSAPFCFFTQFSEAKARGESVREHEKGVPFLYYNWNKYVNRNNPDDVITKEAYAELSEQDKQQYKGVKNREIRVLFNIDQTLLPMANETAYTTALPGFYIFDHKDFFKSQDVCVDCVDIKSF